MAGFDWHYDCQDDERETGKALLDYVRKLAKDHGLETSYRFRRGKGFVGRADGPIAFLQVFEPVLLDEVPAFVAGYNAGAKPRSAYFVASSYLDAYFDGVTRNEDYIAEVMGTFGQGVDWKGTTTSLAFNVGPATHLTGGAKSLKRAVALAYLGRTSLEPLVEECHTFAGQALRTALKVRKPTAFPSLVQDAFERGILLEEMRDTLFTLNKLRRNAKHRGQGVPNDVPFAFFGQVIATIHVILIEASRTIEANAIKKPGRSPRAKRSSIL